MESNGAADCVLIIVAVIFPPAAVAFISGCGCDLFVNILLTLLGFFPGLIHALWLVFKRTNVPERRAIGSYRYTGTPTQAPEPGAPQTPGYGTTDQSTAPQPPTFPTPQPTPYPATAQPVEAPPPVGKN
ncbi:hypothetical protein DEU56DRAFT_84199 [Suillus clintonianus]|uniref:uncharacterized protein n=1 Tax=Suillus clintonianus TaxID=1904413 RepID=UPI001B8827BD|nr:uncharacterized protein DEU56DRAFT_84199 [Suillus clintonianus]KAG2148887.1 hypothetical protein DEU56DRAFT_84199 [Suillus clintonianus]